MNWVMYLILMKDLSWLLVPCCLILWTVKNVKLRQKMKIIEEITPLFDDQEMIRIHGDCHFANIIYRPEESFFLIDFDDLAIGRGDTASGLV